MIEKLLIHALKETDVEIGDLPADLKLYEKDVDLGILKIQLQMLSDIQGIRKFQVVCQ